MKVRLIKGEDGTYEVAVERTLPREAGNQSKSNVKLEDIPGAVSELIAQIRQPRLPTPDRGL